MKRALRVILPVGVILCGCLLLPLPGWAGGVVSSLDEASLRAALEGGGFVTFACDGTITLSNTLTIATDTVLDGSGHPIILSGNNAVRVLLINPGVRLILQNLTVADGRTNRGAGLYNAGGVLRIISCTFSNNLALGTNAVVRGDPGEDVSGGAIYSNAGDLSLLASDFRANLAQGGTGFSDLKDWWSGNGGWAQGGAVYNSGPLAMTNCLFSSNQALGGKGGDGMSDGGRGGPARGGAVVTTSELTTVSNCVFQGNAAVGGLDGRNQKTGYRGYGGGGALCNTGTLQVVTSYFYSNSVLGTFGGGGGLLHAAGALTLAASVFSGNAAAGDETTGFAYEYPGGTGAGGGLFNAGQAVITDTLFSTNSVLGGRGGLGSFLYCGPGGDGSGGAVFNLGTLDLVRCSLVANTARGGPGPKANYVYGANGGMGVGGGLFNTNGTARLLNSTLAANQAIGGTGAFCNLFSGAPGGTGVGAGVASTNGFLAMTNCTLAANVASGGPGGGGATGVGPAGTGLVGGISQGGVSAAGLQNTIVALNTPDDLGAAFAGDHNLIGGDPRLGPLAYNGGLTPTMALLYNSPAIDAALSLPGVSTDQRGVARPFGSGPDIGAFEWLGPGPDTPLWLSSMQPLAEACRLRVIGAGNIPFRVRVSSNLVDWVCIGTNVLGPSGISEFEFADPGSPAAPARFYQLAPP